MCKEVVFHREELYCRVCVTDNEKKEKRAEVHFSWKLNAAEICIKYLFLLTSLASTNDFLKDEFMLFCFH